MDNSSQSFSNFSNYSDKPRRSRRVLIILTVFILLALVIAGGLFMLGAFSKQQAKVVPTPEILPTATPLPTSSVSAVLTISPSLSVASSTGQPLSKIDSSTKLNKSLLSVAVLNGSGIKGAAAEVSAYLEGLGYKIASVGNAGSYTYKNLTVLVKKSKSSYAQLLKKDLQANPSFASVSASVSDEISADAQVIVGN